MEAHRLRAPSTDGALLAEPPLGVAGDLLAANRNRLDHWDHDFHGRRAPRLRAMARAQVLERARRFLTDAGFDAPATAGVTGLVVTGHQPELFHPGVWVKNFAAAWLARRHGALGLNLIVDNDIPRSSAVKVPRVDGGTVRIERVAFDEWRGEVPYEELTVADESTFATFGERARGVLAGAVHDPLLDVYWPRAVGFREQTPRLGLRFALARHAVEDSWGVRNAEVPLSAACETEAFLWFACHLLAELPRFQEVHNEELRRYRALYHIRSRHHPVPALARQGDWLEAPFWVWRAAEPRRRPLLVRQLARTMQLRIGGEDEPLIEIPLAADREACCAVEQLVGLPARGVRLRTRALTTTMFARSLLGDLFIHGIGGAKYDELGDAISGRFFGVEPPAYLTMSMTLWLGVPSDPTAPGRLAATDRELRDLTYNPDRHLADPSDPTAQRWVEAKRRWVETPVESAAARLERFVAIRRSNEALQRYVADRRAAVLRARYALQASVRRNRVAQSREYATVLHSRRKLRDALAQALPGLTLRGG